MMMDEQETIKKTKFFGLNTYEAKIWVSLLSKGTSTAGELSDIANVPRSRSYDVLESLEKKGFVVLKSGKPIKYLAVPPKDVLKNLKRQIENKTEKHLSEIKSTSFNNLIETFQAVLFSILSAKNKNQSVYTGEIYDFYKKLCFKIGLRPLTQRRVSDIICEFELIGIINTKTISKGRYGRTREITLGRTREITLSIASSVIPLTKKILEEELTII